MESDLCNGTFCGRVWLCPPGVHPFPDGLRFAEQMDEFQGRMFAVGVFQCVNAALHFESMYIQRNGLYVGFIVYRGFGKNGHQMALLDELQQDVDFVQFHTYLEVVILFGDDLIERVAGLQPFAGKGKFIFFQFGESDLTPSGKFVM